MGLRGALFMVILAFTCHRLYYFLLKLGVGVHYIEHFPGNCRTVLGIECGSEQIRVASKTEMNAGVAFITNGQKTLTKCNAAFIKGNIFTFDFKDPDKGVVRLSIESSPPLSLDDFGPHGMDILEHDDGTIDLYVVNHAHHIDTVEVFHYTPEKPRSLKHLRTLRDDLFICTNDLTMLGEDKFYITRWTDYCTYPSIFPAIEFVFALHHGKIIFYDNGKSKIVAEGQMYNGITQSADKSEVVSVAGSTRYLHVFQKLNDGGLKFKQEIDVGFFADNINTDPTTGDYYASVQKATLKLLLSAENKTNAFVPSSGVHVRKTSDTGYIVEELFHDSGRSYVQCVSSVAHYKGKFLLGSIFDKLAYCDSNV